MHRAERLRLVVLGILSLIAACRPPIRILAPSHDLVCGAATPTRQLSVGAYLGVSSPDTYTANIGRAPQIVKIFRALDEPIGAVAPGAVPMITFEPTWRGHPRDVLARIARGEVDSLVRARARELRAITRDTIIVELAPEMNARFGAPWQATGTSLAADTMVAHDYRAAWRHIVAVARESEISHVRWLWSPSAGNPYTHHPTGGTHWNWMDRYYPGDDVVDFVGVHAFNDAESQRAWVPFVELVDGDAADHAVSTLVTMHPRKPIILGEMASSELPGKPGAKGAWITAAFDAMQRCAPIVAVVWFDTNKERDWRINSSAASLAAFRAAVRR